VDVIAARLGLGSHYAPNGFAEFGVIVLEGKLGLSYSVQIRVDDNDAKNRILIVSAI
jgi:hypothetical protein